MSMSEEHTPRTPAVTGDVPNIPGVRLPQDWEFEDVIKICNELHRENGAFPLSEPKLRTAIRSGFDKKGGIIGVIGKPGEIESIIVMVLSTFWYTDESHVEELFSYVRPRYRRSENAKRMIEWAKGMADGLGLRLFIGVVSNIRTEAKMRLYQLQLGKPAGGYFIYGKKATEH
jgi:GNAT superfamily N-acetyltransferase